MTSYLARKGNEIERLVGELMADIIKSEAEDPAAHMLRLLEARCASPAPARAASTLADERAYDWSVEAWLFGLRGISAALSTALLLGESPADDFNELAFARGLDCSSEALQERLLMGGAIAKLASCLAESLSQLQEAQAVTATELHDKFAVNGSEVFTLQLGGLEGFYGGLEALVGAPDPQVRQAMERDHCELDDASEPFEMPNRKAITTSVIEWRFVTNPAEGADGKGAPFVPYPSPKDERQPLPLESFEPELTRRNDELAQAGFKQAVGTEEFWAVRLYTGPMYLKYNAVLRGLQFEFAKPKFEALCRGNTYTTTLHCINSAIIKLSKLTKAAKVYRGVWGGVLPEACRTPNCFGVRGGVEGGFMSTTTDKATASFYAKGGSDKAKSGMTKKGMAPAVLFETQMGMVDRGADVGWLSQFPKEEEILFAPLTGMEVRGSRVEGAVQVYEVTLTVNMASLTIEQVLGKRGKLVHDMCSQLASRAAHAARQQEEWSMLRQRQEEGDAAAAKTSAGGTSVGVGTVGDAQAAPKAVARFLEERLMPLASRPAEHYNENAGLGRAITGAVEVAELVASWPRGLAALVAPYPKKPGRFAWAVERRSGGDDQRAAAAASDADRGQREAAATAQQLLIGSSGLEGAPSSTSTSTTALEPRAGMTVDELARWRGPLVLRRCYWSGSSGGKILPNEGWVYGACALMWMVHASGEAEVAEAAEAGEGEGGKAGAEARELGLDLSDMMGSGQVSEKPRLRSQQLGVLSRALAPSLTSLDLSQNDLTGSGSDFSGLRLFCDALRDGFAPRLRELKMAGTDLRDASERLVRSLMRLPLTALDLSSHGQCTRLTNRAVEALGDLLRETRTLASLNMGYNSVFKAGAAFAAGLQANRHTLTTLLLNNTDLAKGKEELVWRQVAAALEGSAVTTLDISSNYLKAGGLQILAELLPRTRIAVLRCRAIEVKGDDTKAAAAALLAHAPLTNFNGVPVARLRQERLVSLDFGSIFPNEIGVRLLAQLLPLQTEATALSLRSNMLAGDHLALLAPAIGELGSLTRLDLSMNNINATGLQALCEALPRTPITTLELGQNRGLEEKSGAPGVAALAGVLHETKLKRVGFKGIDYPDKVAFDALVQAARSRGVELDEDTFPFEPL